VGVAPVTGDQPLIRNCRFAFRCHGRWDLLEQTHDLRIRYCHECAQDVVLCLSDGELTAALEANHCVAIGGSPDTLSIPKGGAILLPSDRGSP
jgi:hypothetical protein